MLRFAGLALGMGRLSAHCPVLGKIRIGEHRHEKSENRQNEHDANHGFRRHDSSPYNFFIVRMTPASAALL
jgi:hypothetical protein